jgi:hypothetical protein
MVSAMSDANGMDSEKRILQVILAIWSVAQNRKKRCSQRKGW